MEHTNVRTFYGKHWKLGEYLWLLYSRQWLFAGASVYAWLCAEHASTASAYASELVRNRVSRMNSARITFIPLTFAKRSCFYALRRWFMRRVCVECSWNTSPYLLVCDDVHDMSVFVNDTCAVHAWFVSNFCLRHPENLVNFSTYKPNLCMICEWFGRDRLCDWSYTCICLV